jgi:hypothetical protein
MPRPRKSVEQHKREGTYQPCRHAHRREVQARDELGAGSAPLHLTDSERHVWAEVLNVAPPHLLKSADRFMLEAFVAAVAAPPRGSRNPRRNRVVAGARAR